MTRDVIEQIIGAEEQAEVLCRASEEKAKDMREEMEKGAAAHYSEVEQKLAAEHEESLASIRNSTELLMRRKRAVAEAEAEAIKAKAEKKIDRAVNLMVWGIVEKCQ